MIYQPKVLPSFEGFPLYSILFAVMNSLFGTLYRDLTSYHCIQKSELDNATSNY